MFGFKKKAKENKLIVVVFANTKEDSITKLKDILSENKIKRGYSLKILDSSVSSIGTCIEVTSRNQELFKTLVSLRTMDLALVG